MPSLLPLCPTPVRVMPATGELRVALRMEVSMPGSWTAEFERVVEGLTCAPMLGADAQGRSFGVAGADEAAILRIEEKAGMSPEAYRLEVTPSAIRIESSTPAGAWRGLQTVRQLWMGSPEGIPCCVIEDAPVLARRGYMLDISRCKVPTMETLFALVDLVAYLKGNELQLYTEHTFAFQEHGEVWKDASPLTAEEVRVLDGYCRQRFIELVPNFNSLGHWERWLRHPQYHHLAECPEGATMPWGERRPWGTTLAPGPQAMDLLDTLYRELLPNFSSRKFNVGLDEPWELGQGRSRKEADRIGKHRVYLGHLNQVHQRVSDLGYAMEFWADIVLEAPELVTELPRPLTSLVWGYEADYPFAAKCAHFARAGMPFLVCPGTSTWNSLGGRHANMCGNLRAAIEAALEHGAIGWLLTDWGDNGHHQVLPISLPALVVGFHYAWSGVVDPVSTAEVVDTLIFSEPQAGAGALIEALGRVPDVFSKKVFNATVLNKILFARGDEITGALDQVTPPELRRAAERLHLILDDLRSLRLPGAGAVMWTDEIALSSRMMLHAVHRALHNLEGDRTRDQLEAELEPLIAEHERVWGLRNRPGGLEESAGHLRRTLALYRRDGI